MDRINLFTYIKDFVDNKISNDNDWMDLHNYETVVDLFNSEILKINNEDFIIILLNPFIPDTYRTNGTKEKLFTKLIEVLFSDWCRRMWLKSWIIRQKSNIEDVRFFFWDKAVLTDSKTFRLWRSQKAPNHKDFLKLSSVEHWITNFNKENTWSWKVAIGGMVTYTNQHEWGKWSESYTMCSDKKTPTLMIPYTYLSLLLELKDTFNINDLVRLWDYERLFPSTVSTRQEYWKVIDNELSGILNISIPEIQEYLKKYEEIISEFIKFTMVLLNDEKKNIKSTLTQEISIITDILSLQKELTEYKIKTETMNIDKIVHNIKSFRQ